MVVPFSDIEASYLIGLTYRLILRQAILTSHEITPNRKVYNRINAISWEDYYQKIIKPRVKERNISPTDLEAASDLRSREAGLMQAHGVHLVLTGNDFLLTDDHLAWFRDRFKNRTIYSETGGHMGHLWKKDVRDAMRAAIRQPTTIATTKTLATSNKAPKNTKINLSAFVNTPAIEQSERERIIQYRLKNRKRRTAPHHVAHLRQLAQYEFDKTIRAHQKNVTRAMAAVLQQIRDVNPDFSNQTLRREAKATITQKP